MCYFSLFQSSHDPNNSIALSTKLLQHFCHPEAIPFMVCDFVNYPRLLRVFSLLWLTCQNHHFVYLPCAPQQPSVTKYKLEQKNSTKFLLTGLLKNKPSNIYNEHISLKKKNVSSSENLKCSQHMFTQCSQF